MRHELGTDFIKAVTINLRATKLQVSPLNKLYPPLSNAEVREVPSQLPEAISDIAACGNSLKIEGNEVNRELAAWLKQRGIISPFGDTVSVTK